MFSFRKILGLKNNKIKYHDINPEDVFLDSYNVSEMNLHQMEGSLEKPLPYQTSVIVSFFVLILLFSFSYRLFNLQIVQGKNYLEIADKNHLKSTPIFALRGTISDINGTLLAFNEGVTDDKEVPLRKYINLGGFSNILGYVSYPKKDKGGFFWQNEYIGKDGVEKQYQQKLQGKLGERIIGVNARNEIEIENITSPAVNGENIKLTIDAGVQNKLYESIKNLAKDTPFLAGSGVIMDVETGEILAMTTYPEYDSNLMTNAKTKEEFNQISDDLQDKKHKFLNRAVSGLFTPGSTIKPFIAIAALMEKVITPEKEILSTGALVIKNKYGGEDSVFKDWKAHGLTDMRKAIAESSDEYFYQVGGGYENQKGLGIERIDRYAKMFGFTSDSGIDLPNENSGIIPTPEWKKKIFNEDWKLGDTYHTSIGQYGFQITPIELAKAYASIANDGYFVSPHILLDDNLNKKISLNLNIDDLKVVQDGLRQGATIGTGQVLNIPGVKVVTKTGTAELGVKKDFVNSWIVGYFPYDKPKYTFVVIMEKGPKTYVHGAIFAMKDVLEYLRDNTEYMK